MLPGWYRTAVGLERQRGSQERNMLLLPPALGSLAHWTPVVVRQLLECLLAIVDVATWGSGCSQAQLMLPVQVDGSPRLRMRSTRKIPITLRLTVNPGRLADV